MVVVCWLYGGGVVRGVGESESTFEYYTVQNYKYDYYTLHV